VPISEAADKLLTANVLKDRYGIRIDKFHFAGEPRIGVWLSETKKCDGPDGIGDSVTAALENAAYKLEMAAKRGRHENCY
jgi:hypothetical protein